MAQIILHPREGRTPKDYALMYIGLGWRVFPVWQIAADRPGEGGRSGVCACVKGPDCDRPGKHPIADLVPAGVSDATGERAKVEAWWGARPSASIGIATGAVSGLTVVDADVTHGKPGLINLTRICAERGGVPSTFSVVTGSGGLHLYFKYNAGIQTGTNVLAEAIDIRNDGGYVIAPPSVHMMGVYKWREERAELLEFPEWMLNAPQQADRGGARSTRGRGRPRQHAALPLPRAEEMLRRVDPDDRDTWLKMGLILGRAYVGSEAEPEAWAVYEAWAARSEKFDEARAENIARMRQQFYEVSQQEVRPGAEPIGMGSLVRLAREGGWTPYGDRVAVPYESGAESTMCSALVEALVSDLAVNRHFSILGEVRDVIRAPVPSVRSVAGAMAAGGALPECLVVRKTSAAGLQVALSERAVLAATGRDGMPRALAIPETLAGMILKGKAGDFPPLTGVAEWPMVMNGEVLMRERGYDVGTGLFFDIDPAVVLDRGVTAAEGWAWIRDEMLQDFPFESDLHRVGALAMMLAMMQRPLMRTCPAFAVVAPQPGTGKSTLIEMAAMAIHGSQVASHAMSNDEEEIRKALHSLIMAKLPMVMFDNLGRGSAVSSDHLSKLITSENSTDRTLGSSETRRESNTLLITFTGNNISFVRDMASRVVTVRLNAKTAAPTRRRFRHPDIRAWAYAERNRLLSALVAIAVLADGIGPIEGSPSRFADYDALIVKPILAVTGVDVRELDVTDDVDAEEDAAVREVLRLIWGWQQSTNEGQRWRTLDLVESIAGRAFSDAQTSALKRFAGDQREWDNNPTKCLGYALRSVKGDYRYHPFVALSRSDNGGVRWVIENSEPSSERVGGF